MKLIIEQWTEEYGDFVVWRTDLTNEDGEAMHNAREVSTLELDTVRDRQDFEDYIAQTGIHDVVLAEFKRRREEATK